MPVGTHGDIYVRAANGRYMARTRFRDYDGTVRPVSKYGRTETEAKNLLRAAIRDRQCPDNGDLASTTRVRDLADIWLTQVDESSRSARTKEHYRYSVESYVKKALGDLQIREVNVPAVERAIVALETNHGPGVARSAKSVLSGMFGLAVRHGACAANPVTNLSPIATEKKRVCSLTRAEAADLVTQLRASHRALELDLPDLVDFMLATGARIGEVCAARTAVLDLEHGTWEVNATVIRLKGQGLSTQERPKTEAGWRVLALPQFAVDLINRRQGEKRLRAAEDVVFGSPGSRSLRDPSNTPGDLREVLDAAGYEWVTSHVFRKTVATWMDEAGCTARQIADQLGHARPSLTQDVYMGRQVVSADAARILAR